MRRIPCYTLIAINFAMIWLLRPVVRLLLSPFVLITKLAWLRHLPSECRLSRRMKQCNRYMGETAAAEACAAGRGTLIWEIPRHTITISRLWWTEDEIEPRPLDVAPDDEFDLWLYANYLAPVGGKALLVRTGKFDTSIVCAASSITIPSGRFIPVGTSRFTLGA